MLLRARTRVTFLALTLLTPPLFASRADFLTRINDELSPFAVRSVFVLPGETVNFAADTVFRVEFEYGSASKDGSQEWTWTAPKKSGLYTLHLVSEEEDMARVVVNAFVLVPHTKVKKGRLRGYRIGSYPRGEAPYDRPSGFVEVTKEIEKTLVSPHFQLKQFTCKQSASFPKFIVLREKLLTKLEMILEKVRDLGFPADTLRVVSGFRTPAHNRSRGARLSRHQWGDAADIFVDSDEDGRMDDLNGDGRHDSRDSEFLSDIVDNLELDQPGFFPVGGVGLYPHLYSHGSFIHVDARGNPARWIGRPKRRGKRAKSRKVTAPVKAKTASTSPT